ncbi:MAG: response regulator [Planctomycetes bacterium]|nr:response regulator [Planctomycetota bacterium]
MLTETTCVMATEADNKNRVVLVVDDEALIRWSLSQKLQDAGFSVLEADTGRSALSQISHDGICAILLDLRLPDVNGLEVLRELRKTHPECCVWIMTAYGSPDAEQEAADLGVLGFLNKPFDMDELVSELQSRLKN